jgi:hypothetical protein
MIRLMLMLTRLMVGSRTNISAINNAMSQAASFNTARASLWALLIRQGYT